MYVNILKPNFKSVYSTLSSFRDLGMFKESEHVLKEALESFMQLCGEESSEIASVLNNLGWTYMRMLQFQKSTYVVKCSITRRATVVIVIGNQNIGTLHSQTTYCTMYPGV